MRIRYIVDVDCETEDGGEPTTETAARMRMLLASVMADAFGGSRLIGDWDGVEVAGMEAGYADGEDTRTPRKVWTAPGIERLRMRTTVRDLGSAADADAEGELA